MEEEQTTQALFRKNLGKTRGPHSGFPCGQMEPHHSCILSFQTSSAPAELTVRPQVAVLGQGGPTTALPVLPALSSHCPAQVTAPPT